MGEQMIPAGYKQTEIGVIPEDWEALKMGELAKIQRGASPRPIDSPIWFDRNSTIGWLRISDVSKTDKYLTETTQNLSDLGVAHSRFVPKNNLVMSICATVGKPIITKRDLCIHDGFVVFNGLSVNQDFMYYILKELEDEWSKQGQTGSQMNLNTELINTTYVAIPKSKKEQTAIANALSDVDALISEQAKLIAKKQAIKTATMQQLLTGKTRLPPFAHHPDGTPKRTQQTELGEIPEDWEVDSIGNLISITTGSRNTQDRIEDGTYPFFVRSQTVERINTFSFDGEAVLTAGDGVGTGKIFHYINGKFDFHQRVYLMYNFGERLDGYFFYIFFSNNFYERIMSMTAKSSVDSVRREMIADMKIVLPTIEEQTAIAQILSDMDEEIQTLEQRLSKTRQIKQGMMQQLLTGKVRLVQGSETT